MTTPAELWEQYQPRFAEAKLRDKEEQTLVFLIQPARVGRFLIAPLTLRRVLYLEAYRSPFIGGDAPLNKWSVLDLLWVLSPQFTPSPFKRKLNWGKPRRGGGVASLGCSTRGDVCLRIWMDN